MVFQYSAYYKNILLKPQHYSVIATTNLNGDFISDALAAQVGGVGMSPGANINFNTGHAVFEPVHGTAPDIAGENKANPVGMLLSGAMLFEYIGWQEASDELRKCLSRLIELRIVTHDLHGIDGAILKGTQQYADAFVESLLSFQWAF